jgi:hypothetical protein
MKNRLQKQWMRPAGGAKGGGLATRSYRLLLRIVRLDVELTFATAKGLRK